MLTIISGNFHQKLIALGVLLMGGCLLWVSIQQIGADLRFVPADGVVKRYYQQHYYQQIAEIDIDHIELIQQTHKSVEIWPRPEVFFSLGMLYYWQYQKVVVSEPEQATRYLQLGLKQFLSSAQYSPVQPAVWFRIAQMQHHLNHSAAEIRSSLTMSILMGRVSHVLLLPRVSLGLQYQDNAPPEFRKLIHGQFKLAQRFQKQGVIGLLESPYYAQKINTLTSTLP